MSTTNFRRTKIIATMGPACSSKETLSRMIDAGLDVARLNFSHSDHSTHETFLNMIRELNEEKNTNLAILQDLQGPKIRLGNLKQDLEIKPGDKVVLRSDLTEQTGDELPIIYDTFAEDVKEGDQVLLDDGKVELRVLSTDGRNRVVLQVVYGEVMKSRKGVNLPLTNISLPTITEKDFKDIDFAIKHNVEWLALSFVRSADDIRVLKELIRLKNGTSRIVAKIEKPEALSNIDEIIQATDAIMVARGDLGVEIPMEDVPAWQKRIVKKCNMMGKPVIVATQMMESMIDNPRPTRAEANDVANALVDGADCVMLSGETSVGKFPVLVVESMDRILKSVENEEEGIYHRMLDNPSPDAEPLSSSIITTACRLAEETKADAIIGMTHSGYTAIQLARCRPKAHIYIFTHNRPILNTLNLIWGVKAFYYDKTEGTDQTMQDVQDMLKEMNLVKPGDIIVNTGSMPLNEKGLTNMIKISRVRGKR